MYEFKEQRGKAAYIQKQKDAERKHREGQQHSDNLSAVNRIADELVTNRQQDQSDDDKRAFREKLTIVLLFATIFAAGMGDVFFYGQMQEMKRVFDPVKTQATAANNAYELSANIAKQQLRPYVLFDSGNVSFKSDAAFVAIILKNTGQTPAYSMRRAFDARVDDFQVSVGIGLQKKFEIGDFGQESADLGNGTPYELSKMVRLTEGDVAAIRSGAKAIYMWGKTRYIENSIGIERCFVEEFYARSESPLKIDGDWPLTILWNNTYEIVDRKEC